jgi:hypothetical protein
MRKTSCNFALSYGLLLMLFYSRNVSYVLFAVDNSNLGTLLIRDKYITYAIDILTNICFITMRIFLIKKGK